MKLIDVYSDREKSIRFLYELLKERQSEPEYGISFSMPTMQQHRKFVCSKPYWRWYIVVGEGTKEVWLGTVSATKQNEIGVHIKKEYRGQGQGYKAVTLLMSQLEPLPAIPSVRSGCWLANINPANERSKLMFTKLGFRLRQETYALEPL